MTNFNAKHALIFFLFFCAQIFNASADVIVTKALGGGGISNDGSTLHPSGGQYKNIGNIVIADQLAGDFANGTNRTITIGVPTTWQFRIGGSITATAIGPNITAATITSMTANSITVTYTASGAAASGNSITISDIEVQSKTKVLGGTVNITRTGGSGVIAGLPVTTVLAELTKVAGVPVSLQVLRDGQINVPGGTTGKSPTGTITKVAGQNFSVTVNAVDYAFNICTTVNHQVQISSNNYITTANTLLNLVNGTVTFTAALTTVKSGNTITATNITNSSVTANNSNSITISRGVYSKLLILLPGEVLDPGSENGKTGTPTDRTSNVASTIYVYATDEHWNRISSGMTPNEIKLFSNDTLVVNPANKSLAANGSVSFSVTLKAVGQLYDLKADDISQPGISYTTGLINVVAGAFSKLQFLLPGESSAPFTTAGKTGTPFSDGILKAGENFQVIVNAVDANWNVVKTVTDNISITNVSATYASSSNLHANVPLVAGTAELTLSLKRAATNHQLRATHLNTPAKTASTSPTFTVLVNDYAKLQVLLPGEVAAPGTTDGKTGTPTDRLAGTAFSVTVNAVDAHWNRITDVSDLVQLSTTSANATIPAAAALANGTKTNFSVTLRELGTTTIKAVVNNEPNSSNLEAESSPVNVVAGTFVKLQILMPGETAAPGTTTGKTGTPSQQVAGNPFTVTVNAVDAAWNVVTTVGDVVKLTTTDLAVTLPSNEQLVSGTKNINVSLISAGTRTITANNVTDGSKTLSTSPNITLVAGAYSKLVALLPNQVLSPSYSEGITGNPAIPARGTSFTVRLRAVDAYFNPVNGATNTININNPNPTNIVAATTSLVVNNYRNLTVNMIAAGVQQLSFTDAVIGASSTITIPDPTSPSLQTDHFRSIASGTWSNSEVWESSTDGTSNWHAATLSPNSTSNTILIRSGHTIEVLASVAVDQVTIVSGGELVVNTGTLTVADGADAVDMLVNGVLSARSTGVIISTAGALSVSATGKYVHNFTTISGTIPIASWADGSTCEFIGYTSYAGAITNGSQTFSNIVWNCPQQNNAVAGPGLGADFNAKNVHIVSTGTGIMYLGSGVGISNIAEDLVLTTGKVGLTRSGTKVLNIVGNLSLGNGELISGAAASTINFNGTTSQTYTNNNVAISGAISFAVSSGATVDFGSSVINGGTGAFTLADGATIITAHPEGLAATGVMAGAIQNIGTRTYGVANYNFNGTAAQLAGSGLPATVNNLTISNPVGVTLANGTGSLTVNGVLTVPSGSYLDFKEHPLAGDYTISGTGTLRTAAVSNAFAAGKTWNLPIEYNASTGSQNIVQGTYNWLLATSGAGIKIGPSGDLNVAGNWSSNEGRVDLATNNTNLNFNGSGAQSIVDLGSNGGGGLQFHTVNFLGAGLKTLSSGNFSLATTGSLTMGAGATLNANSALTILSSSSSSGAIAAIPSNAQITGSLTVQRFVKGGAANPYRTYRMFSSPIHDNIANKTYSYSQFIDDMPVTGVDGAINGFDVSGPNAPTAWYYDPNGVDMKYVPIPNIYTSLKIGQGAYLFYRGDRSTYPASVQGMPAVTDGILDFEGTLNQQAVSVPLVYNASVDGFNLVGNPYASSINWTSSGINKSDLASSQTWSWNSSIRQYAVYDGANSTNGGSAIIPSGQGFFVKTTSAGGTLTFNEDAKVVDQPSFLLMSSPIAENGLSLNTTGSGKLSAGKTFGKSLAAAHSSVKATLSKNESPFYIETLMVFQDGKSENYVASEDASYMKGNNVFFSSLSADNKELSLNYMPLLTANREVKLAIEDANVASGDYTLTINNSNLPVGFVAKLKDAYLNTEKVMQDGEAYAFSIDKDVATSFGLNRFSVMLESPSVLPLEVATFKAAKVERGVALTWNTLAAKNANHFDLERAGDDQVFKKIYTIQSKGEKASYSFTDNNPLLGNNYYKLKQVDHNLEENFTNPVVINFDNQVVKESDLVVFPNPVVADFTLRSSAVLNASEVILSISNSLGQIVYKGSVRSADLASGVKLSAKNFASGIYIIEVLNKTSNAVQRTKIIKP